MSKGLDEIATKNAIAEAREAAQNAVVNAPTTNYVHESVRWRADA